MKKSQLRNIIRESIKELMTEQSRGGSNTCNNIEDDPVSTCPGFVLACADITSQTAMTYTTTPSGIQSTPCPGGSNQFWDCCKKSGNTYIPGGIWDTNPCCKFYIDYGNSGNVSAGAQNSSQTLSLTPYGIVGGGIHPGCCTRNFWEPAVGRISGPSDPVDPDPTWDCEKIIPGNIYDTNPNNPTHKCVKIDGPWYTYWWSNTGNSQNQTGPPPPGMLIPGQFTSLQDCKNNCNTLPSQTHTSDFIKVP